MPYRIRLLGKCPTHSKTSSLYGKKKISIESKTSEHMRTSLTIESVSEGCPDPKTQHENTQKASVQVRYRSLINYWSKRLQKLTFRTKSRSGPPGFHTGFISGCFEGGWVRKSLYRIKTSGCEQTLFYRINICGVALAQNQNMRTSEKHLSKSATVP